MPGDDDLYQQQWNLRPRIDALRAEAKSLRQQNNGQFKTKESELGIERDRLAREQYGVEQSAKSADIQVNVERREVASLTKQIREREASAAAAEKRGAGQEASEYREFADGLRATMATHEARARQAELDAAELRERAAGIDRRRTELKVERDDLANNTFAAEREIDKLEEQADLLQQARLKWTEADIAGDDVGRRSALSLEADALVAKAGAIEVDRSALRVVLPDVPDTTPGIDDEPGPLPDGAIDWSEYIETSGVTGDVLGSDAVASIDQDAGTGDDQTAGSPDPVGQTDDSGEVIAATIDEQPVSDPLAEGSPSPLTFEQPAAFADDTSFADTSFADTASFEPAATAEESFAIDSSSADESTSFDV